MSEHEHDWHLFTDGVFCKCGAEMPSTPEELKDELAAAQKRIAGLSRDIVTEAYKYNKLHAENQRLLERVAELEELVGSESSQMFEVSMHYANLKAENQRLREALEKCEKHLPKLSDLKGVGRSA